MPHNGMSKQELVRAFGQGEISGAELNRAVDHAPSVSDDAVRDRYEVQPPDPTPDVPDGPGSRSGGSTGLLTDLPGWVLPAGIVVAVLAVAGVVG